MFKKLKGKTNKTIIAVIVILAIVMGAVFCLKTSFATEEEQVTSQTAGRLLTGETLDQYVPELRSQATVKTDKISISAKEPNNLELTATLITSSEEYCKLYKNPVLTFSVPEDTIIKEVGNAVISGGTELAVLGTYIDDNKVIVALQGEQTSYTQTTINTQVKVPVQIEVPKMGQNSVSEITMTVENQNDTEARVYKTAISVNALEGLVLYTGVANYGENLLEFYGNQENNLINLNMDTEAKTITVTGKILNNYAEDISNLKITLNPTWTHSNGQTEPATFKLGDLENGSFVYDSLPVGQLISFSATVNIPDNLYYNETLNIGYSVEYTHINLIYTSEMNVRMQTEQKDFVGKIDYLSIPGTENKVRVEAIAQKGNTMLNNNDNVYEGETITYTYILTNLTGEKLNNINIKMKRNNQNTLFYNAVDAGLDAIDRPLKEYKEITESQLTKTIESLENKEIKTVKYEIVAQKDAQNRQISNTVDFSINNVSIGNINTINNNIVDGQLKVTLRDGFLPWQDEELNIIKKLGADEELNYIINLENLTSEKVKNATVKIQFPEYISNVEFHDEDLESSFENGEFTFNIDKIEDNYTQTIDITIGNLTDKKVTLDIFAVANVNDNEYVSNTVSRNIIDIRTDVKVSASCNVANEIEIKENDKLEYTVTLKNNGVNNVEASISDLITSAVEFNELKVNNEVIENYILEDGKLQYTLVLAPQEQKEIKIFVTVLEEENVLNELSVFVAENNYEFSFYNPIYQEQDEDLAPIPDDILVQEGEEPGDNTNTEGTHSIKGKVWLDSDKNGRRDDIEENISGVEVYLVDANNQNNFVKDSQGNILKATTNENGEYEFNNIANGTYFVIFEYDTNKYELTIAKAQDVEEGLNSDGKDYLLQINNQDTNVAITDAIALENTNIYNIDLGLKLLPKFDLKLDKYISKTVVQNDKGTQTKTYINENVVKVEIPAKYISNSTIVIEYTIRVTNLGDMEGYVSTVVDNLPEGLKFSSDYNKDWYQGTDGNLYNTSLANTKLGVGESKDLTLVLTKIKTDNEADTILNNAEITKTINTKNLEEADLVNNANTATVIISIKTGEIIMTSILVVVCISIIGLGIYEIKKRIIK